MVKFWKIKGIGEKVKIKAYEQPVRTILLYGMETRPVSRAQVTRLECFQTRVLRRIGNSQSHITHESNEDLRVRLGVPSVESFLIRTRIRMWQKLCDNPIQSVITSLTGRIHGEEKWGSTPHLQQLVGDLQHLSNQGGPHVEAKLAKTGKINLDMHKGGMLSSLTKAQTHKALCYTSKCENRQPKIMQPPVEATFACNVVGCNSTFTTHHRLQTHRVRTHGYRDLYRSLVENEYCPMCGSKFASKVGAMNHIQKVCGVKGTEEEREKKVKLIQIDRRVATGEITALQASLLKNAT